MMRPIRPRTKKQNYWTLVVIPHSQERVTNWRIPRWAIQGLFLLCLVSIISVTYLVVSYQAVRKEVKRLEYLDVVNAQQGQEIKKLQQQALDMQQKLQEVADLDRQVREMVGLKANSQTTRVPPTSVSRSEGSMELLAAEEASGEQWLLQEDEQSGVYVMSEEMASIKEIEQELEAIDLLAEMQAAHLENLKKEVSDRLAYLAAIPSRWPLSGRITSPYGWRRSPFGGTKREFHDGLDIAGRVGDPVVATGGGKVVFAGWRSGYGQMVTIDHGYGYRTSYAHNSKILVKVGQTVKRGDVISRVGSTGRSTGPHLHYTVEYNGKIIDPLKVLP